MSSTGTLTSGGVDPCQSLEVQQGQVQSHALGSGQSPLNTNLEDLKLYYEGLGVLVGEKWGMNWQ